MPHSLPPTSTYRLQITDHFTLDDATGVVSYLAELGIGAVYVSPLLQATSGSQHGYDVVDHRLVDPERGGAAGLAALSEACHQAGLGLVVDIVPNHMGVADPAQNEAWWDLLRSGRQSEFASWFDVDWDFGRGRVLIPVLGDDADLRADLTIEGDELHYFEHRFPLAPGTGCSGDDPQQTHDRQHYELINFRLADTHQNYRRFFAVTDLAGLRVENPEVHDATHREILRWVSDYGITGIRIDHPDGLADPETYLERLTASAPGTWVTVEKIVEPGERLPASWPVAGTTGYDALAEVNGLLVDPDAEEVANRNYAALTGDGRDWESHIAAGKRMVAHTILCAEVRRMARLLPDLGQAEEAISELAVAFGVYRSYLPLGSDYLADAVALASERNPGLISTITSLLPRLSDPSDELCVRFQQLTGAIMAKGVEDTAFYRYSRLIALNEVGSYPGTFGSTLPAFHDSQATRLGTAPEGMTTLSTHDTKRGEDLRARLAVLAELPEEWADVAGKLLELAPVPNAAFGYLLWQTLVATGLIERERIHAYAQKAMREAADGTGWIDPDAAFEAAVGQAVDAAYDDPAVSELVTAFARRIEPYGWSNALSQKLVQLTMPGVPDVYQGSELFEGSLVDPDNRRPVDFDVRRNVLAGLSHSSIPELRSPSAKLWLTTQALKARRDRPELFTSYQSLVIDDPLQHHLVAYDRGGAVTLATRLPVALEASGGWADSEIRLPAGQYRDVLTDRAVVGTVKVGRLLDTYPVALLLVEVAP
jgi:(1->4)-alpha-D-glucan 1-alpha-D-glucosylmutase